MEYNLPYFGSIDLTNLKEYYHVISEHSDNKLSLDLNFENKAIEQGEAAHIKNFLQNIDKWNEQNHVFIGRDFEEQGEASDYIEFYLDEFDEPELLSIIGDQAEEKALDIQLLNKLKLIRVGCYPDGKYGAAGFGIFDYSIDIDGVPCNQLLVVKTNEHGDLVEVTWES